MHIENLKVGDWVIVTGEKPKPKPDPFHSELMLIPINPQVTYQPTGIPVQVKAISPPFVVCLCAANGLNTINLNNYKVTKALPKYVKVFKDYIKQQQRQSPSMVIIRPNEESTDNEE